MFGNLVRFACYKSFEIGRGNVVRFEEIDIANNEFCLLRKRNVLDIGREKNLSIGLKNH